MYTIIFYEKQDSDYEIYDTNKSELESIRLAKKLSKKESYYSVDVIDDNDNTIFTTLNKCDFCGEDFTETPYEVYDENFNKQDLIQCEKCYSNNLNF